MPYPQLSLEFVKRGREEWQLQGGLIKVGRTRPGVSCRSEERRRFFLKIRGEMRKRESKRDEKLRSRTQGKKKRLCKTAFTLSEIAGGSRALILRENDKEMLVRKKRTPCSRKAEPRTKKGGCTILIWTRRVDALLGKKRLTTTRKRLRREATRGRSALRGKGKGSKKGGKPRDHFFSRGSQNSQTEALSSAGRGPGES